MCSSDSFAHKPSKLGNTVDWLTPNFSNSCLISKTYSGAIIYFPNLALYFLFFSKGIYLLPSSIYLWTVNHAPWETILSEMWYGWKIYVRLNPKMLLFSVGFFRSDSSTAKAHKTQRSSVLTFKWSLTANQSAINGLLVQSNSLVGNPKCWASERRSQSLNSLFVFKYGRLSILNDSNNFFSIYRGAVRPFSSASLANFGRRGLSVFCPRNSNLCEPEAVKISKTSVTEVIYFFFLNLTVTLFP